MAALTVLLADRSRLLLFSDQTSRLLEKCKRHSQQDRSAVAADQHAVEGDFHTSYRQCGSRICNEDGKPHILPEALLEKRSRPTVKRASSSSVHTQFSLFDAKYVKKPCATFEDDVGKGCLALLCVRL